MATTTYGWLVLAFPARHARDRAGLPARGDPRRAAGWIATGAIFLSFLAAIGALISSRARARSPPARLIALELRLHVGIDAQMSILVDPLSYS